MRADWLDVILKVILISKTNKKDTLTFLGTPNLSSWLKEDVSYPSVG